MNMILSIVAILLSIAGVIYGVAYWRGKVDSELGIYREAKMLERLTKMETKFDFVWSVFVEQLLTERPHLATKQSPLRPTEQGQLALSEIMGCLDSKSVSLTDQILYDIPQRIGIDKLRDIADRHKVTLAELLALISLELSTNHTGDNFPPPRG